MNAKLMPNQLRRIKATRVSSQVASEINESMAEMVRPERFELPTY